MIKKISISLISFGIIFFISSKLAFAANPTLSISSINSNGDVSLTTTGDPNNVVILNYYTNLNSAIQNKILGNTDTNGFYSTTLNTSSLNVTSGTSLYLTINNQNSPSYLWPYNTSNSNSVTLDKTAVILSPGQTSIINTSNASSVYISSNSNPSVVNSYITNNTQISITGGSVGSSILNICSNTSSICTKLFVLVLNNSNQLLTFSQNNISLSSGQNQSISIYNSSNYTSYNIVNNGSVNGSIASINGSTLTITGTGSNSENYSITVCTYDNSYCGILNINYTGANNTNNSTISFSQSSPIIQTGQNLIDYIYGSTGTFSISSNSNPNSIQASILSGNSLNILGISPGSSNIIVCSTTYVCGNLLVTNNSSNSTTNLTSNISINQNINVGQSLTLGISGGNSSYYLSNFSQNNVSASVSGTNLIIRGLSIGTQQITLCSTNSSCYTFNVVVSNNTNQNTSNTTIPTTVTETSNYIFNNPLKYGDKGQEVIELQKRLHQEGYLNAKYSTYFGLQTVSALKAYQKDHGLKALGSLGPGTRAALNK